MPPAAGGKPLPASALKVRWNKQQAFPSTVGTNTSVPFVISFTNVSDTAWPDIPTASPLKKDGSYAVRVAHTWFRADAQKDERRASNRTELPRPLQPGESIDLPVTIRTPSQPGDYNLTIELVQELVQWFADRGADRVVIPVRVVGAGAAASWPSGQSDTL
jgi:hypothetical protein